MEIKSWTHWPYKNLKMVELVPNLQLEHEGGTGGLTFP